MDIKIQQLKHFLLVAEEGGFRAASAKASRSQAALSSSVKELERNLGQALFETGHKAKLTPFGEFCLPKVKQFFHQYQTLEADLRAAAEGQRGKLAVACVPSVAAKLIPGLLATFTKSHPKVEVSLIDDNAAGVEARLLAGEVDLALGNCLHTNDERIAFTPLFSDPIGVVCLNNHPLAEWEEGVSWQQVSSYPFIKNGTCELLSHTAASELAEKAIYSVKNIVSLFSVLARGIGVTTLPKLAFPDDSTSLVWLPLKDPIVKRQIGIFRLLGRPASLEANVFLNCV
ncbi:LysR family transcriptional regulator [Endozoicomonas sp. SM1973]|uniref:LysR family transcriptional regulator n=1 Tax=Spartinivicinus marinus TaxID=2994442 RepID=A0A853IDN8_9GAMM|nr:LysR family transcriptional regulator [Spartinivicinus marinus]MCX4026359.1 LysR substrate-binding domain-containing protein [Spartinivicinus marinus]NYZ67295.1 LysR family transcriptional regulator [Spartinivicinus marinus]